ncbi:MAG: sigma-54 dependent transcriptional regulator [Gammaproteobacteria bacterium]|nr:sigma-54 dependent transcriptional regulator [Gammaproteobacteria bacterium]
MNQILIIEDESVIRNAVRRLLERHGYDVAAAASVEEAQTKYDLDRYDLIIADVRLPGASGTEVIQLAAPIPVLIMTSYASIRSAVEAMKLGAFDYIAKPFEHDELLMLVERSLKQNRQLRQQKALKSDVAKSYPVTGMIGRCPAMLKVTERIDKVAPTDATVLILGESGTGKELVARALHEKSHRNQAPFIAFNCAAVPEHMIEAELFGQGQGETQAGLLKMAEGGTLFLDEIGELPLPAQARLLRILQTRDYDDLTHSDQKTPEIRVIAATHRDIRQLVQNQTFRSDLYFRLRVVEMNLPPLRERGSDIQELAHFLLERSSKQLNRPALNFSRSAKDAIRHYRWPGNIRELSNTIERAVILCEGDTITPELLAIDHQVATSHIKSGGAPDSLSLEEYFRQFVIENQDLMTETEMARKLGISRKALWERRQRFGIPRAKRKS